MANDTPDDSDTGGGRPGSPGSGRTEPNAPRWSIPDSRLWQVFENLSDREQRIIGLVVRGYSSKEIGRLENDPENAIEQVVKRVRAKCGGVNRRELTRSYIAWESSRSPSFGGDHPSSRTDLAADRLEVDRLPALSNAAEGRPQPSSVHRDDADDAAGSSPSFRGPARPVQMVLRLPVGIDGSGRNALKKLSSTLVVFLIATVPVILAGAILSLLHSADAIQLGH